MIRGWEMFQKKLVIQNKSGLHARPAALFVQTANKFESEIRVSRSNGSDSEEVSAKSIMGIMMLAASQGCEITISASGSDAPQAIKKLANLVSNKFGEE
jgi:phosphotransferase system HPr (HPr) family protein